MTLQRKLYICHNRFRPPSIRNANAPQALHMVLYKLNYYHYFYYFSQGIPLVVQKLYLKNIKCLAVYSTLADRHQQNLHAAKLIKSLHHNRNLLE